MGLGSQWLLAAALLWWGARSQVAPRLDQTVEVVPFNEVWSRSYCRPVETLVDVLDEFPHEVEYLFKPACVPLKRCSGCCGDEELECVAVETRPVAMQVLRISPTQGKSQKAEMTFTEHSHCDCRPRGERLKSERDSEIGARRRVQEPNPVTLPTRMCQPHGRGSRGAEVEAEATARGEGTGPDSRAQPSVRTGAGTTPRTQ